MRYLLFLNFPAYVVRFLRPICVAFFGIFTLFSCVEAEQMATQSTILPSKQPPIPDAPSTPETIPSSSREALLADYENYLAATVDDNEWSGRVKNCDAGDIPKLVREQARRRWDYYRRQVGFVRPLVLDEALSWDTQYTALIMQANDTLTHEPTKRLKCYTEKGAKHAGFNLSWSTGDATATTSISALMRDLGNGNEDVGHRAWFLHPNVHHVAIAASNNYSVVGWRIEELRDGKPDPATGDGLTFAAWPPKGYVVARLVYERWSWHYFAQVEDEDISQTEVTMIRKDTQEQVPLRVIARRNTGKLGLRTIVWEPTIQQPSGDKDLTYVVRLRGFVVEGEEKAISYEVTLVHTKS